MKGGSNKLRCRHSSLKKGCFVLICTRVPRHHRCNDSWLVLFRTCDVVSLKFLCTLISQLCTHPPTTHTHISGGSHISNHTPGKRMHAAFPLKRDQSHCCYICRMCGNTSEQRSDTTEHQLISSLSHRQILCLKMQQMLAKLCSLS